MFYFKVTDEQGYLQMSPANRNASLDTRLKSNTFDFEPRQLNLRLQEPTENGSESTPMLTLNNLPRISSESDAEDSSLPYLSKSLCPRIDEEADEVFETKLNNAKNCSQNRAVTNPTYIAFESDLEKKPQNISYVNMRNGLIKLE